MNSKFEYYNHLGFFNPYYYKSEDKIVIGDNFEDILNLRKQTNIIDTSTVIESVTRRNIFGDRTIIKGVNKTPWMSKPNSDLNDWETFKVPVHQEISGDSVDISEKFMELLTEEISEYINGKKNIGILLTGGMDSRVIAAILQIIRQREQYSDMNIVALTWGHIKSRDVVYSKEIAKRFKWEWKHYTLGSEDLLENIELAAIRGSEYAPIHLHRMNKVRNDLNLDCILAGSFGDSIGRGEYAGRHVSNLVDIRDKMRNRTGFLKEKVIEKFSNEIDRDITDYWNKFPQEKKYQQLEQDFQIHYMRRKLNPCLSVINEKTKVFQVFTSPKVYGYIWSIHPKLRNNQLYKEILSRCPGSLLDIPWARTGLIFDDKEGLSDTLSKEYHSYSDFINNELYSKIKDLVLSERVHDLGIFNMGSIKTYLKLMKMKIYKPNLMIEEKLIWMASLSRSLELFNIQPERELVPKSFKDGLNMVNPVKENILNQMKEFYIKYNK